MSDKNQYIQVDFLAPYQVSAVVTQGSPEFPFWVTKYTVYYSTDGINYYPVVDSSGKPTIFNGNTNQHTPVTNYFSTVVAQFIQIRPVDFSEAIGLRFDVYGCKSPPMTPVPTTKTTELTTTPATPPPLCMSGWSSWINRVDPAEGSGDFEKMTAEEAAKFCHGGILSKVECIDAETGDNFESLSEATCTVTDGLICNNDPELSIVCRNYKIRYECQCTGKEIIFSIKDIRNIFY